MLVDKGYTFSYNF